MKKDIEKLKKKTKVYRILRDIFWPLYGVFYVANSGLGIPYVIAGDLLDPVVKTCLIISIVFMGVTVVCLALAITFTVLKAKTGDLFEKDADFKSTSLTDSGYWGDKIK